MPEKYYGEDDEVVSPLTNKELKKAWEPKAPQRIWALDMKRLRQGKKGGPLPGKMSPEQSADRELARGVRRALAARRKGKPVPKGEQFAPEGGLPLKKKKKRFRQKPIS